MHFKILDPVLLLPHIIALNEHLDQHWVDPLLTDLTS